MSAAVEPPGGRGADHFVLENKTSGMAAAAAVVTIQSVAERMTPISQVRRRPTTYPSRFPHLRTLTAPTSSNLIATAGLIEGF